MDEIETSLQNFLEGYNCSQSILMAFSSRFNMPLDTACKISAPFGAGIGKTGNTCGAVSGAIMTLGLAHGFTDPKDQTSKDQTYTYVTDFFNRFRVIHPSIFCRDLLGFDLGIPEQLAQAAEQQIFDKLCPTFVRDAAIILKEMLASNP